MPNTAEQAIYDRLASAPSFHPANAELLLNDWTLEPGDVVTVKSGDQNYSLPIYSLNLNWTGSNLSGPGNSNTTRIAIESTGHKEREPLPELRRKQFEQGRYAYTGFKAQQQGIDEHYQHVVNVTDKGMSDAFGIIGVSIGADGYPVKDGSGNYVWDDSGTGGEIWGHLNRDAWATQILNNIKDSNGNVISLAEVYTDAYGQAIINAINDQRTGTATINANRIKLNATDSITLDARLAIEANTGFLLVTGSMSVQDDLRVSDTLRIGSSGTSQGEETGALYFQGNQYKAKQLILGNSSPFIASGKVLADFVSDSINLNHTHSVTMEEITSSGDPHAGNVKITMGGAVAESDSSRIDFFDIAASQTYLNGVAAAEAAGIASVTLSQAAPSNGVVRVSASNGEYEDVDWRTADLISKITLNSSDTGTNVQKTANVRYSNGDSTTSVPVTIDASAVYAAGQAASTPSGSDIWLGVTGSPGYSYSSRPADTSGSSSKDVGIYYNTGSSWLCLRNGTVHYDGGITGLTAYNGGSPATLYYQTPGGTYASLGSHYWYYK